MIFNHSDPVSIDGPSWGLYPWMNKNTIYRIILEIALIPNTLYYSSRVTIWFGEKEMVLKDRETGRCDFDEFTTVESL